jgi:hypothetical protein
MNGAHQPGETYCTKQVKKKLKMTLVDALQHLYKIWEKYQSVDCGYLIWILLRMQAYWKEFS